MNRIRTLFCAALATTLLAAPAWADRGYRHHYEVTITNLTLGQTFTPQLIATHRRGVALFTLGDPASLGLEILAEGGDTMPLSETLWTQGDRVHDVTTIDGLLGPGQSVTTRISAPKRVRYLSMAAMLIPTNDTFVSVQSLRLPFSGSTVRTALAYDAGTEANDQNCVSIPGPRCGGAGHSPGPNVSDEGYVYVSNGFHDLPAVGDGEVLGPATYDWRNPVARIVVTRVR